MQFNVLERQKRRFYAGSELNWASSGETSRYSNGSRNQTGTWGFCISKGKGFMYML